MLVFGSFRWTGGAGDRSAGGSDAREKAAEEMLLLFLRVRGDRKPSWSYSIARDGKHGRGKA